MGSKEEIAQSIGPIASGNIIAGNIYWKEWPGEQCNVMFYLGSLGSHLGHTWVTEII